MIEATFSVTQDTGLPEISIQARSGEALFVVGPNGAGKSALIQRFAETNQGDKFRHITAHRQNWSQSSAPDIAPSGRIQTEVNILNFSRHETARWRDDYGAQRTGMQLAGLIAAQNHWSRELAASCARDTISPSVYANRNPSPLDRLNRVLARGALTARLTISPTDEVLAQHGNGVPFGFARLSDGERNAVLLCTTIIATPDSVVFLIDEPERHLHRSIIEPLLRAIIADRPDCIFVIATHEIDLPIGFANARTLILRNCTWQGSRATSWDANLLEPGSTLPDDLRRAILGSRRQMLFVEGTTASLDRALYAVLFPSASIVPKESCRDVVQAVAGLRGAQELHWLNALGLIDRDDRDGIQVARLLNHGIVALPVTSIEAIYYGAIARDAVGARQAETLGKQKTELVEAGVQAALNELRREETKTHLVIRRCARLVRDRVLEQVPSADTLYDGDREITIRVPSPVPTELAEYEKLLAAGDLDGILGRYPARESGALKAMAIGLRFPTRKDYEEAFLTCVTNDNALRNQLREYLGPIRTMLTAERSPD
jgi:ABC-type ATPase involved in cell division